MMLCRMLVAFVAMLALSSGLVGSVGAQGQTTTVTILQTSDLHTNLMPWDYYTGTVADWGLARVATLIKQERAQDPNLAAARQRRSSMSRAWTLTRS